MGYQCHARAYAAQASGLIPTFHALCVRWVSAAGGKLLDGGGSAGTAAHNRRPSGVDGGGGGSYQPCARPSGARRSAWGSVRDLQAGAGWPAATVAHPGSLGAAKPTNGSADAAGTGWRATEPHLFADSRFAMVHSDAPGPGGQADDQPAVASRAIQGLVNAGPAIQDPIGDAAAVPAANGWTMKAAVLIQRAGLRWVKQHRAGSIHEPTDGGEAGGGQLHQRAWSNGRARAGAVALLMRGTHLHSVQAAVRGWIATRLVKNPARAAAKAVGCYMGDVSRLLDVCRARAAFGSVDALAACVRAAAGAPGVRVVRVKNLMRERVDSWWTGGFRVSSDGGALCGRRVRGRVLDQGDAFISVPGARPARYVLAAPSPVLAPSTVEGG